MPAGMDFKVVDEAKRTYVFPGGNRVVYEGVESICVRPSGTHRLNLKNGCKVIVPTGWLAIEIDSLKDWVF